MKERLKARSGTWYSRCLYFTWFVGPVATAVLTLIILTIPNGIFQFNVTLFYMFTIFDIVHVLHIIMDFYSVSILLTFIFTIFLKSLLIFLLCGYGRKVYSHPPLLQWVS